MIGIAIVVAWLAIGATVGLIEARRGHWHKGWIVSAVYGPLAIPLAAEARRREAFVAPVTLQSGETGSSGLSIVVGVDGSDESRNAAQAVATLFADRIGRLTLAAVLDFDTAASTGADPPEPERDWPERDQAKAALTALTAELETEIDPQPSTVLLAGDPPRALEAFADENGHDLVVVGTRGHGMSKALFGSCASKLGRQHDGVPVLLVPTPTNPETPQM
jgi:nucleotide-binding universal stress UspA family protein